MTTSLLRFLLLFAHVGHIVCFVSHHLLLFIRARARRFVALALCTQTYLRLPSPFPCPLALIAAVVSSRTPFRRLLMRSRSCRVVSPASPVLNRVRHLPDL